ncbi:MAG: peptidoglycan-binding protein [Christensenellaceae bacterium]
MQQRLHNLGYLTTTPDGKYGKDTVSAVKRFQERNGLISDGYLGTATKELLLSDNVQANSIGLGDSGSDVTRIQERLVALGYLRSATGYFGESTVSALKSFQQRNGLSADGKFGASTNHKLFSDSAVKAPVSTPKKNNNSSNKNNSNKNNSGNKSNNSGSSSGGGNYSYSGSGSVSALIAAAESRLGCKYVLGAKGPNQFDCSGLVYWCLNNAGVKQGYMTSAGWRNCGKYQRINSRSEVKAGDILVFRGHVGIAVSNSMMIDASTSKGKVVKRTSYGTYWDTRWICAYRIF